MKTLISFFIIFSAAATFYAQLSWTYQYSGTTNELMAVFFTNENTGYIGGQDSTILKTTNGGVNWYNINTNHLDYWTTSIFFTDQNTGFFAGGFWQVLKTTNAGVTFQVIPISDDYIQSVYFINQNTGFQAGGWNTGKIFRTTDAGNNWTFVAGTTHPLKSIYFLDQVTGFINGDFGSVYKTTDSGLNWSYSFCGTITILSSVRFFSSQNGFISGGGGYLGHTYDGGQTWLRSDVFSGHPLTCLYFVNSQTGYVSGWDMVGRTTNAGLSWYTAIYSNSYQYHCIYFPSQYLGFAVGRYGTILKITDGVNGIKKTGEFIPLNFYLNQNYPDPFNPTTKIRFGIPRSGNVKLMIYDILGRVVETLVNGHMQTGAYEADWYASANPSGVYFYQLVSGDFVESKKMILIK